MSVRVLSRVLGSFHEDSDPADRLVLIVLADAAHDDGVTWVSQDQIAEQSRLSARHVRRCLRELAGRAEIEVRKAQRGRNRISVYRVVNAPKAVEYDRLPFAIDVPFSTTGQDVRPNVEAESDGRTSETSTTGHLAQIPEGSLSVGPVSRTRNPSAPVAPKVTRIDGRDVAFDALAEATGIADGSPRMRDVAVALNGRKGHPEEGIRAQFAVFARGYPPEPFVGERFERALQSEIAIRAALYRQKMPGAALTPTALAKWWTDLPGLPSGGDRISPEEMLANAHNLQERGQ